MRNFLLSLYRRTSIRTKAIVVFCIVSLCPILLVGYAGYRSYEDTMKDKFLSYACTNSSYISSHVGEVFKSMVNFSNSILYDDVIQDAYNETSHTSESDISGYLIKRKLDGYLQSLLLARPELDMVAFRFTGKESGLYVSSRRIKKNSSRLIPMDEMYDAARKDPQMKCYLDAKDGIVNDIYFHRMVCNRNNMQEIGLLVFRLNLQHFRLNRYISSPTESIYLYSNKCDQIFRPAGSAVKHADSMTRLIRDRKGPGVYEAGEDYIIYETIEPLHWNLFLQISSDELFHEVRKQSHIILLLCLSTLPIIFLAVSNIFQDIIKPINILVNKMHQMEIGETGVTMTWNRSDEIGYLVSSFNKMSTEIDDLINRVYKEEIAFANAEIKALQTQINPHFLYNTLETINWKAQLEGVDEISDMVMALSNLMEAGIDRNGQKFVSLKQEMDYVENYTLLIQKRFGNKITFQKEMDPDTLEYPIPKLILQPLIENAIRHGIEPKGKGRICLTSGYEKDFLILQIMDDGVGILNVQRRIQLIYGNPYGLKIKSSPEGTKVIINLPADGKMVAEEKAKRRKKIVSNCADR
ncbi:histidine kinase [Eubacteriales bacterium mix99]